MSVESAKAFIERMKTDQEFADKVTACEDATARRQLIESAGFDITAEEVKSVASEFSQAELQNVSGGWGCWECPFDTGF